MPLGIPLAIPLFVSTVSVRTENVSGIAGPSIFSSSSSSTSFSSSTISPQSFLSICSFGKLVDAKCP